MPRYSYIAKTLKGRTETGIMEAKSEHELANILRQEGCILIKTNLEEKGLKKGFSISIPFINWIPLSEKIMFTRNLRVMVSAGVSLPRALNILAVQSKNKKFKNAISKIKEEIIQGKSFSETLEKYPDIFSELFHSMMKVGEETGTTEDVLKVLTSQMEKEYQIRAKIKGAMIYPAVIVLAMLVIGIVMLIMVVPKLASVFSELNVELPLTTRMVIYIGNFLAKFWYTVPFMILVVVVLLRLLPKTKSGKLVFDTLVLKLPIISPIIKKTYSAHTVRTLSSLIIAGVPIVRSLEIVSNSLENLYYKKAITQAVKQVRKGGKLAEALKGREDIYPNLVFQMLEVGEETGETADILKKLAEFYEEEVGNATKNLSAVIEPVLMLIIGAVVGFFAISMIQPIYSIMGTL
ncbi:MAG: hypothetical protein COU42_03140 [Candidatus Nealsonbacteria bacterium CG10_big_fil_rev_8_21_14_0_10_36_24]|uniref:Type II secretion system protein GspF domain-containing protein n=2 Tax=Candidatus Nealsoniibacteriota TaxID=1817911 RepID=A0A2H0YNW7_9BACT|nr:MAG: hypothetical protein COU42_03140 [Candidatus Nealsonbacteria bacterium CG10_big_fil_rev_8_21_14_0_10_36_24]PIS40197.1 MAG: hypothetical protein COT32_01105 [Candidatus Nealsonbacteria bacterium CG08_land_8_20_14_0_20_36_22]